MVQPGIGSIHTMDSYCLARQGKQILLYLFDSGIIYDLCDRYLHLFRTGRISGYSTIYMECGNPLCFCVDYGIVCRGRIIICIPEVHVAEKLFLYLSRNLKILHHNRERGNRISWSPLISFGYYSMPECIKKFYKFIYLILQFSTLVGVSHSHSMAA